jgi:hypothetical protein
MDLLTVLRDYGWVGVVIILFAPKLWHFLTDRFYPQKVAERNKEEKRRDDALQAEREARALLLKSQIEREGKEFEHRTSIDNRIAAALENTTTVIQQMGLAITVNNERITQLISAHSRHDNFVFSAHVETKEKLEGIENMIDTRNQVRQLRKELTETQEKIKTIGKDKKGGQPE